MVRRFFAACVFAFLLVHSAPAATKAPPNLGGVWKLDRDLTTAPYVKDDFVVVYQDWEQVKFEYRDRDDRVTGTEVFITDGSEQKGYTSRLERTYYRAKWKEGLLSITTQHMLDVLATQAYKETDTWSLSDDGKTLTEHLSDGKVAVYYWKRAAPVETSEKIREFRAQGQNTIAPDRGDCRFNLAGAMENKSIGKGTFRLCASPDTQVNASGDCAPFAGTMSFTRNDGPSTFVMKIDGRLCSQNGDFLGSYTVDDHKITGEFNPRLTGGAGTVQYNNNDNTVLLQGVLLFQ
jgi:hypothetical protein